jgi:hypothetical protein
LRFGDLGLVVGDGVWKVDNWVIFIDRDMRSGGQYPSSAANPIFSSPCVSPNQRMSRSRRSDESRNTCVFSSVARFISALHRTYIQASEKEEEIINSFRSKWERFENDGFT